MLLVSQVKKEKSIEMNQDEKKLFVLTNLTLKDQKYLL